MITNQLRNLEQELTLQTHALRCLINETEIRIAVKKAKKKIIIIIKITNLSQTDKIKNEIIKSAVNESIAVYLKLFSTVLN